MRNPQPNGIRGSLKWIQRAVNERPEYLNRMVREACNIPGDEAIEWVSPLADDEWAEYRDTDFLDRLDIQLRTRPLHDFWPRRGPQWDALGRTGGGAVLLVEGKANIPELVSPPSQASSPRSLSKIRDSLNETQRFLGVDTQIDWTAKLYQYANRLAHLYLLSELNGIDSQLLFIYFVGDEDVNGPRSVREWKAALTVVKGVLGLPGRHRLSACVSDVFIDVAELT